VPERFIVYNHKLIAIRYNGKYFECLMDSNGTEVQVYAKSIICTLPIAVLREIQGFDMLPFSDKKKEYIKSVGVGQNSKFGLEYKLNDSLKPLQKVRLFTDAKNQQLWDSTFAEMSTPNKNLLITGQLSGEVAKKFGPDSIQKFHQEVQKLLNQDVELINSHGFNWSLSSFAKGSKTFLSPGQVLGLSDTLEVGEINDQFIFAGEAFSRQFQGTLEGALSSGLLAAQLAQKSYLKNRKLRI
jgi:monoamine oxidase